MTVELNPATFATIIAIISGIVGVIDWLIRRWLQRHRDELILSLNQQLTACHSKVNTLTGERDQARQDLTTTATILANTTANLMEESAKNSKLQGQVEDLTIRLATAESQVETDAQTQKTNDNRVRRALELRGAIWTQPVMAGTPEFVPLSKRRTPIVSVLNLKGGVGKTTVTAYLARTLAARGYRVLLVDLDLQGSLSSLFVDNLTLTQRVKSGGKLLQDLLSPVDGAATGNFLDYTLHSDQLGPHGRIVPTTDMLAYAELSQTVQWLLRVGGKTQSWNGRRDGRMILRKALHRKSVYGKFDIVLMDCPPLVNLCCANALAASDYVLTPVTPSVKSIERVPSLLTRIMEVQCEVNQHLKMLGIVVNNTRSKGLTPAESDLLLTLPERCLGVYGTGVYLFDTNIPSRVAVRDQEQSFSTATEDEEVKATFEQLTQEFLSRMPNVCRHPDERLRKRPASMGILS